MRSTRTIILTAAIVLNAGLVWGQVPDMRAVVQEVYRSGTWDLTTKQGNGCFTEAVAFRLAQADPNWGHLAKFGGQNNWNGHAVDAILHRSGYAVDIISSSESPNARPSWGVDNVDGPRYTDPKFFIVPKAGCGSATPGPTPGPTPTPQPPAVDLGPILSRLSALEANLADVRNHLTDIRGILSREEAARVESDRALQAAIDSLPTVPTRCIVRVFGVSGSCRLE